MREVRILVSHKQPKLNKFESGDLISDDLGNIYLIVATTILGLELRAVPVYNFNSNEGSPTKFKCIKIDSITSPKIWNGTLELDNTK